jgi:hypothetical protein
MPAMRIASMHKTPTALLTLLAALQTVAPAIASDPLPIVCSSSSQYVGYDGQWSPITIRVGTPEQWLSVLPSTLSQETWLVGPAACDGTLACTTARGGLFYSNESSTFRDLGYYELGSDPELGNSQYGYYGLDTIALNDDASESGQIIALLNTSDVWVGEMGLGVQQTRINGSQNTLPLLSSLVQSNATIPSHSYGYTAGAAYRLKGVPASLTLGGVDTNRFTPNNLSLTLNSEYAPVVAVNSISVSSSLEELPSNWNSNPTTILDTAEEAVFTIDSSTPYLWVPTAVADSFASSLNLTYNDTLELYVYSNETSPEVLQAWNLTFTFEVGNLPGSTDNVQLTLPYEAFNLELTYGFPGFDGVYGSPPLPYFPVRRSNDSTNYILGRAFLQETYLVVDYERNMFTINQAVITEHSVNNVNLSSITRPSNSIFGGPESTASGGLPTGAKIGIGVGVGVAVLLLAALLIWWFIIRHKRALAAGSSSEKPKRRSLFKRFSRSPGSSSPVAELLGDKRLPTEVPADSSTSRFELPAAAAVEMPAAEVSPTFFQSPTDRSDTSHRNDPRDPAELGMPQAQTKQEEAETERASERSASPVPPYSCGQDQSRLSNSVSPYSARHSQAFGTVSSGTQGISPVGHSSNDGSTRDSNHISSPVSPVAAFRPGDSALWPLPQDGGISEPGSISSRSPINTNSSGPHLTPPIPTQGPARSISRSSRFVEEDISDVQGDGQHSSSRSARFSWEE